MGGGSRRLPPRRHEPAEQRHHPHRRAPGHGQGSEQPRLTSRRRSPPIDLNALVEPNVGAVVGALSLAVFVLLLIVIVQARRIGRLGDRIDGITRGERGKSLESILDAHLDKVYAVAADLDEIAARSAVLEAAGKRAFQRVGLVRFNPFEDTGGNQSFALALLDGHGDGVVLSSLHARTGTRVYAKTLTGGRAEATLSSEETEAVQRALESGREHPVGAGLRSRRGA